MPPPEPQAEFPVEIVPVANLRPHPRNYQTHPDDELDHIAESIREHGVYKNVVVARDYTILAGHGVALAAPRAGYDALPVRRFDLDPNEPRALKLLAADNEIRHLAVIDDRVLSELLKQVHDEDAAGLLGTGYDEAMLANLLMVTRPESEIADFDAAAAWIGMPDYEASHQPIRVIVSCWTQADRDEVLRRLDAAPHEPAEHVSIWYPPQTDDDVKSLMYEDSAAS